MKLAIDIGNTRVKTGLFEAGILLDKQDFDDITANQLSELIQNSNIRNPGFTPVDQVILSSVKDYSDEIKDLLSKQFHFIELDHQLHLPIKLNYKTIPTLGKDRIALAVAAAGMFPDQNVLVIDAGTCITYDFVNAYKEYLGGGISPGILMRFKALHTFTDKLPLVSHVDKADLIGDSTEGSIRSGVINGAIAEVNGIIENYKQLFPDLMIILSGGDTYYFDKNLKYNIFANSNLVLEGLNMILDYNVGT